MTNTIRDDASPSSHGPAGDGAFLTEYVGDYLSSALQWTAREDGRGYNGLTMWETRDMMARRLVAGLNHLFAKARAADENTVLQDDLREMLRALGLSDAAQPRSPHEVFWDCIAEVNRLKSGGRARASNSVMSEGEK